MGGIMQSFQLRKFKKASSANMVSRAKKMYNHRTGSRPFSYIVEEMAEDGSKFLEVHAFELAYAGKNKCWTDNIAKTQYDEMFVKIDEYLLQKAKEQLPEDAPLEEIPVNDPEVGLNIMMSILGEKPRRQIRGLGNGLLRNIRTTSHVRNLEQELEVERTARKAADASRVKMEEMMQNKLKVVGRQFNSTLHSLHHSMQQICHNVPVFVMPPFKPLSIDDAIEEHGDIVGEENNFEEEYNFDEDE